MAKQRYFLTDALEPQMVLHGPREAVIEQCGEIAVYDSGRVRLRFGESWLEIKGTGLVLGSMSPSGVNVRGCIGEIRLYGGGIPCSD